MEFPMYDLSSRGMTPERKKMIHNHRKQQDLYGPSLPYDVGKFSSKNNHTIDFYCPNCSTGMKVGKNTCLVVCSCCNQCLSVN